jgi:hypothetical protein
MHLLLKKIDGSRICYNKYATTAPQRQQNSAAEQNISEKCGKQPGHRVLSWKDSECTLLYRINTTSLHPTMLYITKLTTTGQPAQNIPRSMLPADVA